METKSLEMTLKSAAVEATGFFKGYLSVFGIIDLQGDVVARGAFRNSIAQLKARQRALGSPVLMPILWQHTPHEPVGGWTELREDEHGLYCEGVFDMQSEMGRRAYNALKRGYMGGLSIGYRTVRDRWEKMEGGNKSYRVILEASLIEGSAVTFPANELAVVDAASMKHQPNDQECIEALTTTMRGAVNAYKGNNNKLGSNGIVITGTVRFGSYYSSKTAADQLGLSEATVARWFQEGHANGSLLTQMRGGNLLVKGEHLIQLVAARANEVQGAWALQGRSLKTKVAYQSEGDNKAKNAAFLASIPEGDKRDMRSDREASEEDYQATTEALAKYQEKLAHLPSEKKATDVRFSMGDGDDDDGGMRPLMSWEG